MDGMEKAELKKEIMKLSKETIAEFLCELLPCCPEKADEILSACEVFRNRKHSKPEQLDEFQIIC